MRKKLLYEAPDSEELVFRLEGNFCQTIPNNLDLGDFGGDNGSGNFDPDEEEW